MRLKYIKKRMPGIAALLFTGILLLSGCQGSPYGQNRAFEKFTKEMFCRETASNSISLHYTLKNPEEYGIKKNPVTFGTFETDGKKVMASVENLNRALEAFSYGKLSEENRITFDVLEYSAELAEENARYLLYEEPLGLVSGVQTQLPVVLSEYSFHDREDVEEYLNLLKTTPEYVQSLIDFEKKKSKAGLFMSEEAAEQVVAQCTAFMDMGESNYLISTFAERIKSLSEFSEKEKSDYIKKNALMLNSYVLPAYSKLSAAVQELKGTGKNEKGLCYLPSGREYYEYVVKASTGSGRTVEEIRQLTKKQMLEDLKAMEEVIGKGQRGETQQGEGKSGEENEKAENREAENREVENREVENRETENRETENRETEKREAENRTEQVKETAAIQVAAEISQNPVSVLKELQEKTADGFPAPPDITCRVKYVPSAMEEHLSPAFYMIPAIDSYEENVIYVNRAQMGNPLVLYTTLAHEGYPGHLYQTVYYANTQPNPIRSILNFGGYVEGWATYAEMCSYYLAPLTKEQAVILQKNSSVILGLYTLADIGIHYDGWSRADTADFFSSYGIRDVETIQKIYDLIIGCPGNYLKYYIGYVEFLELKKMWAEEKGEKFSQREFHEAVLEVGPAPFELVEKYMWSKKAAGSGA